MSCCDVNGLNRVFRGRYVRREQRRFVRGGLDERQRGLLSFLDVQDKTVLDIGCGVGALGLSALSRGARQAQLVDVSKAYVDAAEELLADLGLRSDATVIHGDAAELNLEAADIVFLDRVVCCYPDAERLLGKAAQLSKRTLVFTYPTNSVWLDVGRRLLNLGMRLTGNPYRFYLHDPASLLRAATSTGHALSREHRVGIWKLCCLEKSGTPNLS